MSISNELQIEYLCPKLLKDYDRQLRKPKKKQIEKTKRLIETCTLVTPVVINKDNTIVIGGHLAEAARQLNIEAVPVIRAGHLDENQIKILRIAYDRIAEEADWDRELLAEEFQDLEILIPDIDLTLTGFETAEIDLIIDFQDPPGPDDDIPEPYDGPATTKPGDLWLLGNHKLYCGDSLKDKSYQRLLASEQADMGMTDAPYNVNINGHVGNSGKTQHREFVAASGEMSDDEFTAFLTQPHKLMAKHSKGGAIIYSCMDWRHVSNIMSAGSAAKLELLNICVWVKNNGGMGSLYRSQHELVFVFKNGKARHINNIELGKYGRNRTNVWEYPSVNSFGNGRMEELTMHPTVKPVAMFADAIKDCSRRGGIILDPFGGSGTTMIAAEKTGRKARLIELDPLYCDVAIHRWQDFTGESAIHADTGNTFNETLQSGGQNNE